MEHREEELREREREGTQWMGGMRRRRRWNSVPTGPEKLRSCCSPSFRFFSFLAAVQKKETWPGVNNIYIYLYKKKNPKTKAKGASSQLRLIVTADNLPHAIDNSAATADG